MANAFIAGGGTCNAAALGIPTFNSYTVTVAYTLSVNEVFVAGGSYTEAAAHNSREHLYSPVKGIFWSNWVNSSSPSCVYEFNSSANDNDNVGMPTKNPDFTELDRLAAKNRRSRVKAEFARIMRPPSEMRELQWGTFLEALQCVSKNSSVDRSCDWRGAVFELTQEYIDKYGSESVPADVFEQISALDNFIHPMFFGILLRRCEWGRAIDRLESNILFITDENQQKIEKALLSFLHEHQEARIPNKLIEVVARIGEGIFEIYQLMQMLLEKGQWRAAQGVLSHCNATYSDLALKALYLSLARHVDKKKTPSEIITKALVLRQSLASDDVSIACTFLDILLHRRESNAVESFLRHIAENVADDAGNRFVGELLNGLRYRNAVVFLDHVRNHPQYFGETDMREFERIVEKRKPQRRTRASTTSKQSIVVIRRGNFEEVRQNLTTLLREHNWKGAINLLRLAKGASNRLLSKTRKKQLQAIVGDFTESMPGVQVPADVVVAAMDVMFHADVDSRLIDALSKAREDKTAVLKKESNVVYLPERRAS